MVIFNVNYSSFMRVSYESHVRARTMVIMAESRRAGYLKRRSQHITHAPAACCTTTRLNSTRPTTAPTTRWVRQPL